MAAAAAARLWRKSQQSSNHNQLVESMKTHLRPKEPGVWRYRDNGPVTRYVRLPDLVFDDIQIVELPIEHAGRSIV